MQFTPESSGFHQRYKGPHCFSRSDSGYSDLFQSPQSSSGADSCWSVSLDVHQSPKENLCYYDTPGQQTGEAGGSVGKSCQGRQQPPSLSSCNTPRRDSSLRKRLLLMRATSAVRSENRSSPSRQRPESPVDTLELSTLKLEQGLPFPGMKRRLFTQVRTSTLEDGTVNSRRPLSFAWSVSLLDTDLNEGISASDQTDFEAACFKRVSPTPSKENHPSQISGGFNGLNNSRLFCTPSTDTPKYVRSACEDSGFSSFDKLQDSSVDHDGSFQELLCPARSGETPVLSEAKRRVRLQRQKRLSTLKEGGSQSEEGPVDRLCSSSSIAEDVFTSSGTPHRLPSVHSGHTVTPDSITSTKQNYTTPLRVAPSKPQEQTPLSTVAATPDARTTPDSLSLTPALQLVHAMCQQRAQMFAGRSPSLKEQLVSTAELTKSPDMFCTSMPLGGLIGRNVGLGKLDILTELNQKGLRHILGFILSHLSSESIYRCGQVCKSWDAIIRQDKRASRKRAQHTSLLEGARELRRAVHVPEAETRLALPNRSALKTVQAQSRTSSFCTPQSASRDLTPLQHGGLHSGSSSKREKFLEVAKTLFNDECLKCCPLCQHPARCHSVKGEGMCSRADCAFHFCTACLCAYHGSRECASRSVGRRTKVTHLPGSAQSKRNIRRL